MNRTHRCLVLVSQIATRTKKMTDSDKLARLAKRKLEMEHAIRNEFSHEHIARRIENVRSAALAAVKKYRDAFANVVGTPGNEAWEFQKQKWEELTHAQF